LNVVIVTAKRHHYYRGSTAFFVAMSSSSLYTHQMCNIEILKSKSVNVETVNKTPIACSVICAFVVKNQILVNPEYV